MASKIEWTGRSDWNPIRGCTRVSEGCRHCYAERMAGRFSEPGMWGHGIAERTPAGARWTGRVDLMEERLTLPLRWRKPALIFASSTADWFHESLTIDEIATLYAMAVSATVERGHTIQILTKRAARMRELLNSDEFWRVVARRRCDWAWSAFHYDAASPPTRIWLGISAEDQRCADERIPHLLATPAAVRFVSCEPLLGPINLRSVGGLNAIADRDDRLDHAIGRSPSTDGAPVSGSGLDWVIVGGESGPQARPMHPDWARDLRDQCAAAGVPFFFKQHGEWIGVPDLRRLPGGGGPGFGSYDHCSYDQEREAVRVGRARAGRLLDGREHNEMPEVMR
ncbi:MAG: phage Gp37/Gp68 family protein [Rhodovulum sp.]|nr:phage Gp37/Gp68 family protein [Rhodovulum sp.]